MAEDLVKKNKRCREWKKANTERIDILFEKGTKARLEAACQVLGITRSDFVRQAIDEKLKRIE